ncbi:MAG: hypothetical protein RIR62_2876 [Pseudomonadota bacterium]|jgi:hypothetical protein
MIPQDWYWQRGDAFRDFCQWDYDPPCPPATGMFRQAALLWHSLTLVPCGGELAWMFHAIRDAIGPFRTVWGVKSGAGGLSWELYFYDYDRQDRRTGLATLDKALPGLFAPGLTDADGWPWFMASVEFDAGTVATGRIGCVDLYFEGEGGTISAGLSEVWDGRTRRAKNDYRFYRSREDRAAVLRDLAAEPPLPKGFAPGCFEEEIFVISRKAASNAAYFSRVGIDGTLAFAEAAGLDPRLARFLRDHRDALSPYLFDLGLDHRDGTLLRGAIYGIF